MTMDMIGITLDQLIEKSKKYPNDKVIANTLKVIKAEMTNRFNWENYQNGDKTWNGIDIQTQRLVCSYGLIGYSAVGKDILDFSYDWDKIGYDFCISWDWGWEAMTDLPDGWDEKGIDLKEWKRKYKEQDF